MQSSPPGKSNTHQPSKPRTRRPPTSDPPAHQEPARLKQIQYRSYQHDIHIYHFRTTHLSVPEFRSYLSRNSHGYIDTLTSRDTLSHLAQADGDETPQNCIEVAYLPSIFTQKKPGRTHGCALGFRTPHARIEWLCFDRPVREAILESWICAVADADTCLQKRKQIHVRREGVDADDARRLFDFVALMPKGIVQRRVRGANEEHRLWHDGLWGARLGRVALKVTWRNYGEEVRGYWAVRRDGSEVGWSGEEEEGEGERKEEEEGHGEGELEGKREEDDYGDENLDVDMVDGYT